MSDNFNDLLKLIRNNLGKKVVEVEKSKNLAVFSSKNMVYKIEFCPEENRVYLDQKEESEDLDSSEWSRLSSWLFEETVLTKDLNFICSDFVDTICGPGSAILSSSSRRKMYSSMASDSLFFANRLATIFPDLRGKILLERESYSEFRGAAFVKEFVVSKILTLISDPKDEKRIEKLFKLLSDLYKNSSLNIRSLITMGIMNEIRDENAIEVAKKYISDELNASWGAVAKYKDKEIKISKVDKIKRFVLKFSSN